MGRVAPLREAGGDIMTALDIFTYADQQVRTVIADGEPWFVLSDLCNVLGIANPSNVAARLDPTGLNTLRLTEGIRGNPNVTIVNESNMYEVVIRSDKAEAVTFRRWITGTVLPAIRKTGGYSPTPSLDLSTPAGILALAEQFTETARQLVAVTERAETAERFKDAIERNVGLAPRAFHKHYFPDVADKEFFDLLYKRGLLIDQRGKGTRRDNGTFRDGPQHGHPGFKGKPYFYVDSGVSQKTGYRYEQTYVRPGEPEIELVQLLTKWGLTPQTSTKELAHV
jgi:prophage antirepressor-like protein